MEEQDTFTMRQASQILGVSSQRLRRYCNRGLVPGVRQPVLGKSRTFTAEQMNSLRLAHFLTVAGCRVEDIRKYLWLAREDTKQARKEQLSILNTHKRQVWQELEDLQATIDFLERQEELLLQYDR